MQRAGTMREDAAMGGGAIGLFRETQGRPESEMGTRSRRVIGFADNDMSGEGVVSNKPIIRGEKGGSIWELPSY